MATLYSPKIVTDGLVLALDAANTNSFRGEPTTNLFATFSSTENNAVLVGVSPISLACGGSANWSRCNYGGGTYAFNHIETENPYGIRSLVGNLVSTVTGGDYRATISNIGATTLNRTFTFSMWVKNNGGTVTSISMSIRTDGDVNGPTVGKTITNEWQRISITHTFTGTCTNEIRSYLFGLNAGLNILVYGAQLEENPYATQFVNGTRGTTVATGGGWVDRSGKLNHGELLNGPTYNSSNLGSLSFDGSNDYISIPYSATMDFSLAQTIIMWMKPGTGSNSTRRNPYNQAYGGSGTITHEPAANFNYFFGTHGGNNTPYVGIGSSFTVNPNELAFIAVTRSQPLNICRWYKNGARTVNTNAGGYAATNNGSSPIWLANGYTTYFIGDIYYVFVYNRFFTDEEILQTYNATKGRFGL
jgi:hypothetical protein